jgi:hypothetical protein
MSSLAAFDGNEAKVSLRGGIASLYVHFLISFNLSRNKN